MTKIYDISRKYIRDSHVEYDLIQDGRGRLVDVTEVRDWRELLGESNVRYRTHNIFRHVDVLSGVCQIINVNGLIDVFSVYDEINKESIHDLGRRIMPAGIITRYRDRHVLLMNGDDEYSSYANDDIELEVNSSRLIDQFSDCDIEDQPTLSFGCVLQLFPKMRPRSVFNMLASGTLKLVDYCADHKKSLTRSEQKVVDKTSLKPDPGYTLIWSLNIYQWHRPATVLLRDTRRNGSTYLLGMDEGSYFGCELPTHPTNLSDAYTDLMPKHIRGIDGVRRQGEWFIVPVDKNAVPREYDGAIRVSGSGFVTLPCETVESATHTIYRPDTVYIKDNTLYAAAGILSHSNRDHDDVEIKGWSMFVRNTALRSVSVDGVD